jgi:hypothetical protein
MSQAVTAQTSSHIFSPINGNELRINGQSLKISGLTRPITAYKFIRLSSSLLCMWILLLMKIVEGKHFVLRPRVVASQAHHFRLIFFFFRDWVFRENSPKDATFQP